MLFIPVHRYSCIYLCTYPAPILTNLYNHVSLPSSDASPQTESDSPVIHLYAVVDPYLTTTTRLFLCLLPFYYHLIFCWNRLAWVIQVYLTHWPLEPAMSPKDPRSQCSNQYYSYRYRGVVERLLSDRICSREAKHNSDEKNLKTSLTNVKTTHKRQADFRQTHPKT